MGRSSVRRQGSGRNSSATASGAARRFVAHEDEKFALIVGLPRENDELHDSYQSIYGTVAVVAALFLSTLISTDGYEVAVDPESMWAPNHVSVGVRLYHLAIGCSVVFCILVILLCIGLSVQLSHVPKRHTDDLLEELGLKIAQLPSALTLYFTILYTVTLMIQFSLVFAEWVAIVLIVLLVLALVAFFQGAWILINKKMRVLRRIKRRYAREASLQASNTAAV